MTTLEKSFNQTIHTMEFHSDSSDSEYIDDESDDDETLINWFLRVIDQIKEEDYEFVER